MNDEQLHAIAADHVAHKRFGQAFTIYQQLAEKGYGPCQVYVGWMFFEGVGVAKNKEKALAYFRRAADLGHLAGMFYLGRALTAEGKHKEALVWYKKAGEKGYPPALFRLGLSYLDQLGTSRDKNLGLTYLERSARSGNVLVKRELALRFIRGEFGLHSVPRGLWRFLKLFFDASRVASRDLFAEEFIG